MEEHFRLSVDGKIDWVTDWIVWFPQLDVFDQTVSNKKTCFTAAALAFKWLHSEVSACFHSWLNGSNEEEAHHMAIKLLLIASRRVRVSISRPLQLIRSLSLHKKTIIFKCLYHERWEIQSSFPLKHTMITLPLQWCTCGSVGTCARIYWCRFACVTYGMNRIADHL